MKNHSIRASEIRKDTNVYYLSGNPPPRLKIAIERKTWAVFYTGTKEDLIEAGIATDVMFPEERKRLKYHWGPKMNSEEVFNTRKLKGGLFRVERHAEFHPLGLPPEPPQPVEQYNPVGFRQSLLSLANGAQCMLLMEDNAHRLDAKSRAKILQLHAQIVDTYSKARIERRLHLQVM